MIQVAFWWQNKIHSSISKVLKSLMRLLFRVNIFVHFLLVNIIWKTPLEPYLLHINLILIIHKKFTSFPQEHFLRLVDNICGFVSWKGQVTSECSGLYRQCMSCSSFFSKHSMNNNNGTYLPLSCSESEDMFMVCNPEISRYSSFIGGDDGGVDKSSLSAMLPAEN